MAAPRKSIELFLTLGFSTGVLSGGFLLPPDASAQHLHSASQAAPLSQAAKGLDAGQGGEGGEGGEGGGAADAGGAALAPGSDLQLLLVLAQMRGHLQVAEDLLALKAYQAAEPHVGHPADELYGALEPSLQQRGIAPFLTSLDALRQQVRLDPASKASAQRLAEARQAIARAEAAVPAAVRNDPETALALARQLAATAIGEYAGSEAQGRIVEVIEYQDGRGFLLQADQVLAQARARAAASPTTPATTSATTPSPTQHRLAQLQQQIRAMLRAFPSVQPPARAVMTAPQLRQLLPPT